MDDYKPKKQSIHNEPMTRREVVGVMIILAIVVACIVALYYHGGAIDAFNLGG